MGYIIEDLLDEFKASHFQGPIPYSLQHDYQGSSCHLLTICATHGDEIGSLPSALKFFRAFTEGKTSFRGKWTLIWGNPEASKLRQRFAEQDLNRLYGQLDGKSLECVRAAQISQIIKTATLFIDFHQTIVPTLVPFYCSPAHKSSYDLARALRGATVLFSTPLISKNHKELKTQNDFATFHDVPSLTVEIGVKGFNRSSEILADDLFRKLLEIASSFSNKSDINNVLFQSALENPPLSIFECLYRQPFTYPEMALLKGWKNFSPIQQNELIGYKDKQKKIPLLAPQDGVIIFPKYPQRDEQGEAQGPLPEYLYLLANNVS